MDSNILEIQAVIDNLRRILLAINANSKCSVKDSGLTVSQLCALHVLADYSPIRVSDMVRKMYPRPANVVGILDRLEEKGLVSRTRSLDDRRVVILDISETGKVVVTSTPLVAENQLADGLKALTNSQLARVAVGMQQIVQILGADQSLPN